VAGVTALTELPKRQTKESTTAGHVFWPGSMTATGTPLATSAL
jgi:hypothetical protein